MIPTPPHDGLGGIKSQANGSTLSDPRQGCSSKVVLMCPRWEHQQPHPEPASGMWDSLISNDYRGGARTGSSSAFCMSYVGHGRVHGGAQAARYRSSCDEFLSRSGLLRRTDRARLQACTVPLRTTHGLIADGRARLFTNVTGARPPTCLSGTPGTRRTALSGLLSGDRVEPVLRVLGASGLGGDVGMIT